jgi:hypothetical protein
MDAKDWQGAYGTIQMAIKTDLGVAYFQDKYVTSRHVMHTSTVCTVRASTHLVIP